MKTIICLLTLISLSGYAADQDCTDSNNITKVRETVFDGAKKIFDNAGRASFVDLLGKHQSRCYMESEPNSLEENISQLEGRVGLNKKMFAYITYCPSSERGQHQIKPTCNIKSRDARTSSESVDSDNQVPLRLSSSSVLLDNVLVDGRTVAYEVRKYMDKYKRTRLIYKTGERICYTVLN